MKHRTAIAKKRTNPSRRTDALEKIRTHSCARPSVARTFVFHSIYIIFGHIKSQQKSRKVFHFRTSDYLNIHKYCDYFVSIIFEIEKIRSQEFQSIIGNHQIICSFNIGPFRQKQLHHCRLSFRGGYHQGSASVLQDSRRDIVVGKIGSL